MPAEQIVDRWEYYLSGQYYLGDAFPSVWPNFGAGVVAALRRCDGEWCRIAGTGFDGYMKQENLWGAYPGEKVE